MTNEEFIRRCDAYGDFITGCDGFVVFWPDSNRGAFTAENLRTIADELDKRNKELEKLIEAFPT